MSCVDNLLHEVGQRRVAGHAASNQHAIARLRPQFTLEIIEAAGGRRVDDFVIVTRASHRLL